MVNSEKVNILVTGCKGQLGNEIQSLAGKYSIFSFTYIDIDEVDLSSENSIRNYFNARDFQVIVHCAAYTAVDLAEDNPELAYKVNSESVRVLAEIAKQKKIRMIHISTDYVFDGESNQPIAETHKP